VQHSLFISNFIILFQTNNTLKPSGCFYVKPSLIIKNTAFCRHTVFICFA
jgi:hypothetical protein